MLRGDGLRVYLDVYGCQMNVNDTEVVWSILEGQGYLRTLNPSDADVWLVVTCSIRDGAEQKVWSKLNHIQRKKVTNKVEPNKVFFLFWLALFAA